MPFFVALLFLNSYCSIEIIIFGSCNLRVIRCGRDGAEGPSLSFNAHRPAGPAPELPSKARKLWGAELAAMLRVMCGRADDKTSFSCKRPKTKRHKDATRQNGHGLTTWRWCDGGMVKSRRAKGETRAKGKKGKKGNDRRHVPRRSVVAHRRPDDATRDAS